VALSANRYGTIRISLVLWSVFVDPFHTLFSAIACAGTRRPDKRACFPLR
jgi:hypothetical protein